MLVTLFVLLSVLYILAYYLFDANVFHFFFFKQKTAYEMLISDWSSDVCSSDLITQGASDTVSWGTAEFVAQEEMGLRTGYWWSPEIGRASCRERVCQYV